MKSKAKNKKFDSVKMMREIRDKLSAEYSTNQEKELRDLEAVRNKFRFSNKSRKSA